MLFCIRANIFKKEFIVENSICGIKNNIFLCIVYKVIAIILISDEYYLSRVLYKFIGTNFVREKYICFIAKDIEV